MSDPYLCDHVNTTNHAAFGRCATDYCSGWEEWHCRDCGYFISFCPCGCENGADVVSRATRRSLKKKKGKRL